MVRDSRIEGAESQKKQAMTHDILIPIPYQKQGGLAPYSLVCGFNCDVIGCLAEGPATRDTRGNFLSFKGQTMLKIKRGMLALKCIYKRGTLSIYNLVYGSITLASN